MSYIYIKKYICTILVCNIEILDNAIKEIMVEISKLKDE